MVHKSFHKAVYFYRDCSGVPSIDETLSTVRIIYYFVLRIPRPLHLYVAYQRIQQIDLCAGVKIVSNILLVDSRFTFFIVAQQPN